MGVFAFNCPEDTDKEGKGDAELEGSMMAESRSLALDVIYDSYVRCTPVNWWHSP